MRTLWLSADQPNVPHAGCGRVGQLSRVRIGQERDGDAQPLPKLASQVGGGIRAAWRTLRELQRSRNAFLMLIAFLLYNDGIQTIIRMSSIYGIEIGIDRNAQIAAFVLVQFVGVPCSFAFGAVAGRIGAKTALFAALM